jgi:hypothetical protein
LWRSIGEHAASSAPSWTVSAIGPVPEDRITRLEWQQRAASVGAYRELSGYNHPADPIGPEPVTGTPHLRAAWHEALAFRKDDGAPYKPDAVTRRFKRLGALNSYR